MKGLSTDLSEYWSRLLNTLLWWWWWWWCILCFSSLNWTHFLLSDARSFLAWCCTWKEKKNKDGDLVFKTQAFTLNMAFLICNSFEL